MVVKVCIQQNSAASFGERSSSVNLYSRTRAARGGVPLQCCVTVKCPNVFFFASAVPHVVAELLKSGLRIELSYGQATNITLG